jgi:DNA replication ATP-dependent helicase Dna2
MVVGATVYAIARLSPQLQFDTVVIDEAGQIPLAHAVIPMARGRAKLLMAGDHCQLPPVLSGEHEDSAAATSVFAHLAAIYPQRLFLLDTSYRLPPTLCEFSSRLFYGNKLKSCRISDPVLPELPENMRYPELKQVWRLDGPKRALWVNHLGYGAFSPPEAELVARSVASLMVDLGFKPEDVAVVAPHRAQVREIADRLWKHVGPNLASQVIVDTVERMQGQERDVVLLSLCASDPWFLQEEIEFILSPNRLNVSITRSKQLLLVVGSRVFFRTFPKWPEHLELSALFREFEKDLLPVSVDFTEQAHRWVGLDPPLPELLALPLLNAQSVSTSTSLSTG